MLRFPQPTDDHEAWFGAHYAQLLVWATQLTRRDREQAEDLVHDVFVQFMARRPDLTTIQNPEGYLYTSLRHHQLANARRAARMRATVSTGEFDLLAHDSLPQGFRAWRAQQAPGADEPFAQQLRDVWRYTQHRKDDAKTACVLLLRFFHGYYPGEIAQVMRLSRQTVGQLLHLARKEARLFIADPADPDVASSSPDPHLFNPPDLVLALRDAALRSDPDGVCLTDEEIAEMYGAPGGASVPTPTAAHLVSCRRCLDRANRALGLPPLADRHPLDSLGYDRGDEPPGSGAAGASGAAGDRRRTRRHRLDEGRQRLTDLVTHRPHELRIAVNGIVLGSQAITAAVSRQTFRVTHQPFDFLEVLSEQDVRLLLLSVEAPPRGPVDVCEAVELSDGRRLEARIDFSGDTPEVHVSYVDHALAEAPVRAAVPQPPAAAAARRPSAGQRVRAWVHRFVHPIGLRDLRRWRLTRGGAFATVAVATALGALVLHQIGQSVLSAAELLERSRVADALWRSSQTEIVHRTLDVEVRSAPGGQTMRRRVEVWHGGPRGLTVRRAYDEQGQLLAGEWTTANGTRTIYSSRTTLETVPTLGGRDAWRLEPSADDFTRIVGSIDRAVAREQAHGFVIVFTGDARPDSGVASASLTLRDDWRAVEQHATANSHAGTTMFSWIERSRTAMRPERAPADVFDVDAAFAPAPASAVPTAPAARVTPPATASLEIAALTALRRIDADLGGEVRVERADGRLSVTGIVASPQRRAQILSVLGAIQRDPAARVRLETLDEVHGRAARSRGAPAVPPAAAAAADIPSFGLARIPVHDEVRASLIASGVAAAEADGEVARAADRVIRRAQAMRLHAWALRRVVDGVPVAEATAMSPAAQAQWRALIGEHARAFLEDAGSLSAMVRPVLPELPTAPSRAAAPVAPAAPVGPVGGADAHALYQQARAFVEAAGHLDALVQAAFMVPLSGAPGAAPTPAAFWLSIHQATAAAATLDRAAREPSPKP
jgi:RNA polymerase sigma factor (sigma-70 family)